MLEKYFACSDDGGPLYRGFKHRSTLTPISQIYPLHISLINILFIALKGVLISFKNFLLIDIMTYKLSITDIITIAGSSM